uniref:Uncharacterized protein n=1 Tax=Meloidogyne enterolobii TaxID=390850 RepID=A0A6V7TNZ8_MELEN|nr:unnamed protein product [Meloidogyne enterolobii]
MATTLLSLLKNCRLYTAKHGSIKQNMYYWRAGIIFVRFQLLMILCQFISMFKTIFCDFISINIRPLIQN